MYFYIVILYISIKYTITGLQHKIHIHQLIMIALSIIIYLFIQVPHWRPITIVVPAAYGAIHVK